MERGLPCPYHSPARSETLGQASTSARKIMQDSCKIIARCNMSLQGMLDNFPLCSSLALTGRIPREPSQHAPFYEQGSLRALRGLRALLTLFWPTSCQTRPGGAQSSAPYRLELPAMPQTVSCLADVRS